MGKSLRSKRMRANRAVKRVRNGPRVTEKLKAALAFEYNEKTTRAHLSIFHDLMNGPPPAVPGLEPGSKLAKTHLTEKHFEHEAIGVQKQRRSDLRIKSAARALDRFAKSYSTHPREQSKKTQDTEGVEKMDDKEARVFDPKTLRDQYGQYPDWMSSKNKAKAAWGNRVQKKKGRTGPFKKRNRFLSESSEDETEDAAESSKIVDAAESAEMDDAAME